MPNPRYPHMMPDEIPVWERFLATQNPDWIRIDYDVKVGQGVELPPDMDPNFVDSCKYLSKKRIDAVLIYDNLDVLIEVKKCADWRAIGQLLGYPILYQRDRAPEKQIQIVLVTESFTLDTQYILEYVGFQYYVVPLPDIAS